MTTTNNNNNNNNNNNIEQHNDYHSIPLSIAQPALVAYRSIGIGLFGATMRYIGMPLEKIALYMNSSQIIVSANKSQFQQAIQLTFKDGYLAPYKVVGPASITAWFMQYSIMGVAFQFFDQSLSNIMNVRPMYYGHELMEPPIVEDTDTTSTIDTMYNTKYTIKTILSPILAACLESCVSNRAEVQRYYGVQEFYKIEKNIVNYNIFKKTVGPAFTPNIMRNIIMCQTSFLLTPLTYKNYFPQEYKNKSSLFWYGLSLNIFIGNIIAITQQSLWGRTLDYLKLNNNINYTDIIKQSIKKDGYSAFFTIPKWSSRVLMNAPAQGTLPWFYNEILPLGEYTFMKNFQYYIYEPFYVDNNNNNNVASIVTSSGASNSNIQRTATYYKLQTTTNNNIDSLQIQANSPKES